MSLLCTIVAAILSLTNRNPGAWGPMAVAGGVFDLLLALIIFGSHQ